MSDTFAIEAVELRKTYHAKKRTVTAIDGLSLTVGEGQVFGLLGPNGAGKSTTVKILSTLALADSGRARVAGFDVTTNPSSVRQAIGCVSQGTSTDLRLTARENVTMSARIRGMTTVDAHAQASRLMTILGLTTDADRPVKTLSGGLRRRVDIACALVHAPHVIFLDEPTTGLDPEARAALWDVISSLSGDFGLSVVLTTHYLDEADRLSHQVLIVDHGRAVVSGTPEQLKASIGGTGLTVTLTSTTVEAVRAATAVIPTVAAPSVEQHGNDVTLRLRADDAPATLAALTHACDIADLAYHTIHITQPSLDDVYLHHVGHTFTPESQA